MHFDIFESVFMIICFCCFKMYRYVSYDIICINFVGDVVGFGEKLCGAVMLLQAPIHWKLFALLAETTKSSHAVLCG